MDQPPAGGRPHAADAGVPAGVAAGTGGHRHHRPPRLLLPLPRHAQRPPLRALGGTVQCGHRADDAGRAVRTVVLRRRRPARAAHPRGGRRALPAHRMAVAAGAAAAGVDGLVSGARLHRARLDRLRRGDAGLHPRPGLAHASGRTRGVGGLDADLRRQLGHLPGPGIPELRAALRAPVQPRLDRLPRHPRRLHARARHRLLRELAARDLRPALVRDREPDGLAGLRAGDLGPDRQRRSAAHRPGVQGPAARIPPLQRARCRHRGGVRRRHHRADGGDRVAAIRPGDRDPGHRSPGRAPRRVPVLELRLPGFIQPELRVRHPAQDRPHRAGQGLGGQRLHRHRPGADPDRHRQPPQRLRLGSDETQSVHPRRAGACGLHRWLAGGAAGA